MTPLHGLITHPKNDIRSVSSNLTLIVGPTHKRNIKLFMIYNTANLWKPTLVKYISVLRNTRNRVFAYQCQRTAEEWEKSSFYTKISVMIRPSSVDLFLPRPKTLRPTFTPGFTFRRAGGCSSECHVLLLLLLVAQGVQRAHTYMTAPYRIMWCTACDKRSASTLNCPLWINIPLSSVVIT